jgi:branched-chain amino acid transport system ATP-binding protein
VSGLVAEDVVAGYGRVEVLHGVSVAGEEGEVTCIFGPNGCGKSTLLRAMAGAVDTWSGSVALDGEDLTGRPSHEVLAGGLALMPQGGGVFPQLSVRDNLLMGGYTVRSRSELDERIEELLDEFPRLRDRLRVHAGSLSGGEQRLLAIARSLIARPRFMLFDEPSAGLSPRLATDTLARVAALAKRGIGVLLVEQNIREAMRVADRIYVLVGGRNRYDGRPSDIEDDRQLMGLYLGAPTEAGDSKERGRDE